MSSYLKNLITDEVSEEEISDYEFALEMVSIEKNLEYFNAVSRENHELIKQINAVSDAITLVEDNSDLDKIKVTLEKANIDYRYIDISQEGLMDFFKGLVNKVKKKISRMVEKFKAFGNSFKKTMIKMRHDIEDMEELIQKTEGKSPKNNTISYRIYHLINPQQNIEELDKTVDATILEMDNYLVGEKLEKANAEFLKLMDTLASTRDYKNFMVEAIKGADRCVKIYISLPVSKKVKTQDTIVENIDVTQTIHEPLLANSSIATFLPKGGYMPEDFLKGKEGSNFFEIRKMFVTRVLIVSTVYKAAWDTLEDVDVMSVDEAKSLLEKAKKMYDLLMDFKDNKLDKIYKNYEEISKRFYKELHKISTSLSKDELSNAGSVVSVLTQTLCEFCEEPRISIANIGIKSTFDVLNYIKTHLKEYK